MKRLSKRWLFLLVALGLFLLFVFLSGNGAFTLDEDDLKTIYIIFLIILLLLLFNGAYGQITENVISNKRSEKDVDQWLEENHWESPVRLSYQSCEVCADNRSQEMAVFQLNRSSKSPDKLIAFNTVKEANVLQKSERRGNRIILVIKFIGPDNTPYIIPITDKPISTNDPEFQKALKYADQINELITLFLQSRVGALSKPAYVVVKCSACGQLVRGTPGVQGWCPKCDIELKIPVQ